MENATNEMFDWEEKRDGIMGLGDKSLKKNYYPELKRRIQELELFRLMLDQSGDGIVVLEIPSWDVVDCNGTYRKMLQINDEDEVRQSFRSIAKTEKQFDFLSEKKDSNKVDSLRLSSTVFERSGKEIPVEINVSRAKILDRTLAIAVIRDISVRHKAIKELEESEHRYRSYINASPTAVFLADSSGRYIRVNPAACNLVGYSEKELLELSILDITHPSDLDDTIEAFSDLKSIGMLRCTRKLLHRDGNLVYVDLNTVEIEDDLYMAFGIDVTANIQAEKELCRAKEAAEAASRAKDDFIAVMSHEMRTPLNPILGYASLLEDVIENEEQKSYVDTIIQSANFQLSMIDQLLKFSSLSKGDLQPKNDHFDLLDFCHSAFSGCKDLSPGVEIHFENGAMYDSLCAGTIVSSDRNMLTDVFANLLGNACKYTKEGGVTLSVGFKKTENNTALFYFQVTDTGIGIPKAAIPQLFKLFTQVDMSSTREYGGVGLGLAICKRIVDVLHGEISVESELGKGSRFWVELPMTLVSIIKTRPDGSAS